MSVKEFGGEVFMEKGKGIRKLPTTAGGVVYIYQDAGTAALRNCEFNSSLRYIGP